MSDVPRAVSWYLCFVFAFFPAVAGAEAPRGRALAPGVRIERAPPDQEAEARRSRLRAWREIYGDRLGPLRRSARTLFSELEHSSLATLTSRCRELETRVGRIDRVGLFPSGDVELDRMLFGSLERYRVGAGECLAGRYLDSYRLLVEARLGLEWIDRRLQRSLRRPVPLRGLDPPR